MTYKLEIEYDSFIDKLIEFKENGNVLLYKKFNDIQKLDDSFESWMSNIEQFVIDNIKPNPEELISNFKYYGDDFFDTYHEIRKNKKGYKTLYIEHKKNIVSRKLKGLNILTDYLSIIDSLKNENTPKLESVQDRIQYVLQKLYHLYNDNLYSISMILKLNNIDFRDSEPQEIADDLHKRGYGIKDSNWSKNDLIKISVKGAIYIERKNKSKEKKTIENMEANINSRIDIVLAHLEKLGYGQEIIYEEIEELRELSKKLSKKSWGQILKGKIFDLALSEIINKETATFIYESLVGEKLNILK